MEIDLDKYTYNQWLDFVFNHPIEEEVKNKWYNQPEWSWIMEGPLFLEYSTELFFEPHILIKKYTLGQISEGFWFLLSSNLSQLIWEKEIPWEKRQKCILGMKNIFMTLFNKTPLDKELQEISYMWWDLLRGFEKKPEKQIVDCTFKVLTEILEMYPLNCQISAIHGLGHLNHPDKKRVIEKYIASQYHSDDMKKYALAAMTGDIL